MTSALPSDALPLHLTVLHSCVNCLDPQALAAGRVPAAHPPCKVLMLRATFGSTQPWCRLCRSKFDVALTFEERVMEQLVEGALLMSHDMKGLCWCF